MEMISKGGDKSGKSEEKRISGNSRESIREKQANNIYIYMRRNEESNRIKGALRPGARTAGGADDRGM